MQKKMSRAELRRRIDECLSAYETAGGLDKPALILEANFHMQELNRRSDSWISWRDFVLEAIVIALIGWEISEGYAQAKLLSNLGATMNSLNNNLITLR